MKKRILVFPCGSEIGLEIYRSVQHSIYFELIGASSVDDHGKFVYKDYIDGVPFHNSEGFIDRMIEIVKEHSIDAIYPAMDAVARTLKSHENILGCKVIGSVKTTTALCASKKQTYLALRGIVGIPEVYEKIEQARFPLFIKPDEGYGSRNVFLAKDMDAAIEFLRDKEYQAYVGCEYLPGDEYTVDCFSDRMGKLRFVGPRIRSRVSNGISVNTKIVQTNREEFTSFASAIHSVISFRGAWFFQVKRDAQGKLKLLEVAARFGGSSGIHRNKGINFALLTLFDAFGYDIEIIENDYVIELDRSLSNRYFIDLDYRYIYVDYDDCLIINGKVNSELIAFLYQQINCGKQIILITKHAGNLGESLKSYRLENLFDEIIHLKKEDKKANFIPHQNSIFIDDSHGERFQAKDQLGIYVFSPDMVESLMGQR